MNRPEHLADPRDLITMVGMAQGVAALDARLGLLSGYLLGRPYLADPLIGGPGTDERLVTRLDGFDCVTFVESVLALARCAHPDEFAPALRALRYDDGRVDWAARSHYMWLWIERNEAAGRVRRVLPGAWTEEARPRRLSTLAGYPAVERTLAYLPVADAVSLDGAARTGDLVCFASTRPALDAFHVGLLVAAGEIRLRHASRSRGAVVDESLAGFLERNETPGLMVVRLA